MPLQDRSSRDPGLHVCCLLLCDNHRLRVRRGLLFFTVSTGQGSGQGLMASSARGPQGCSQKVVRLRSHPETQRGENLLPFFCGTAAGGLRLPVGWNSRAGQVRTGSEGGSWGRR